MFMSFISPIASQTSKMKMNIADVSQLHEMSDRDLMSNENSVQCLYGGRKKMKRYRS